MVPNQAAGMQAETRKGHREEIEHLSCRIIKTFKPGASFDYDGTVNLFAISLFISLVRGNLHNWSVKIPSRDETCFDLLVCV